MSFGMSYADFWDGDCEMVKYYRKAREIQQEQENYHAWLQGLYVYRAVGALAPSMKAFSKAKPGSYLTEPIGMTKAKEKVLSKRQAEIEEDKMHEQDDLRFNAFMTSWMSSVNKHMAAKDQALKQSQNESPEKGVET